MPSSPTLRLLLQERLKQEFTKEQRQEVADFYFNHYRTHISSKRSLADALASIPQVPAVLCVPGECGIACRSCVEDLCNCTASAC